METTNTISVGEILTAKQYSDEKITHKIWKIID